MQPALEDPQAMHFSNLDAVKASDQAAVRFHPPRGDSSIPKTDEEKQKIVESLVLAIYDTTDTAEMQTTKLFQLRWVQGNHYKSADVEKVVWKVLEKTIKLHRWGWTAPVYDESVMIEVIKTAAWSFGDRIRRITALLRWSKTFCESLLKGERYWMVIGMPGILLSRSKVNKNSNRKKKARLDYVQTKEREGELRLVRDTSQNEEPTGAVAHHTIEPTGQIERSYPVHGRVVPSVGASTYSTTLPVTLNSAYREQNAHTDPCTAGTIEKHQAYLDILFNRSGVLPTSGHPSGSPSGSFLVIKTTENRARKRAHSNESVESANVDGLGNDTSKKKVRPIQTPGHTCPQGSKK